LYDRTGILGDAGKLDFYPRRSGNGETTAGNEGGGGGDDDVD
jgi:hypothetical protein